MDIKKILKKLNINILKVILLSETSMSTTVKNQTLIPITNIVQDIYKRCITSLQQKIQLLINLLVYQKVQKLVEIVAKKYKNSLPQQDLKIYRRISTI